MDGQMDGRTADRIAISKSHVSVLLCDKMYEPNRFLKGILQRRITYNFLSALSAGLSATLKSIDYDVAMTFILNNNNNKN